MAAKPRLRVPATARPGEVIAIKTLVSHPMESGQRTGPDGAAVPRKILHRFVCLLDGVPVFEATLEPAMAANPYLEFHVRVARSGTFRFEWTDDDGGVIVAEQAIAVL